MYTSLSRLSARPQKKRLDTKIYDKRFPRLPVTSVPRSCEKEWVDAPLATSLATAAATPTTSTASSAAIATNYAPSPDTVALAAPPAVPTFLQPARRHKPHSPHQTIQPSPSPRPSRRRRSSSSSHSSTPFRAIHPRVASSSPHLQTLLTSSIHRVSSSFLFSSLVIQSCFVSRRARLVSPIPLLVSRVPPLMSHVLSTGIQLQSCLELARPAAGSAGLVLLARVRVFVCHFCRAWCLISIYCIEYCKIYSSWWGGSPSGKYLTPTVKGAAFAPGTRT